MKHSLVSVGAAARLCRSRRSAGPQLRRVYRHPTGSRVAISVELNIEDPCKGCGCMLKGLGESQGSWQAWSSGGLASWQGSHCLQACRVWITAGLVWKRAQTDCMSEGSGWGVGWKALTGGYGMLLRGCMVVVEGVQIVGW